MLPLSYTPLLFFLSILFQRGTSWSNEVVCFDEEARDLAPVQPQDCTILVGRLFTLPYFRHQLTWSPHAYGPSRLPYFIRNGDCQLWFVDVPNFFGRFERFAMIEVARNLTSLIGGCIGGRQPHERGPKWGGYIDVGDYEQVRMSLVRHMNPPRPPEEWPRPDPKPHPMPFPPHHGPDPEKQPDLGANYSVLVE